MLFRSSAKSVAYEAAVKAAAAEPAEGATTLKKKAQDKLAKKAEPAAEVAAETPVAEAQEAAEPAEAVVAETQEAVAETAEAVAETPAE